MLTYEKLSRKPGTFGRLTGVGVGVFSEMAGKVGPLWEKRRNNHGMGGGSHSLPGVGNHLLAMPICYRWHVTYEFMGFFFNCDETTAMRAVKRIGKMAVRVIRIGKKRGFPLRIPNISYLTRQNSRCDVRRGSSGNLTAAKRKGILGKHGISRIRKEKSVRSPRFIPAKPMISPYTKSRRRETASAGFRKRQTTDIGGYGNTTEMPKFLIKNPGAES